MKVLIVGSGVIGLSTAFELALSGYEVKVVTRNYEEGTSWVAGGMLAPFSEGLSGELLRFSEYSLSLYPDFINCLEEIARMNIFFSRSGILRLVFSEEEFKEINSRVNPQEVEILEGEDLYRREPVLSREPYGGFLFKREGNVDAEKLMDALIFACENLRVKIQIDDITEVERKEDRIEAVKGYKDTYHADFYVFTTGAWSKPLLRVPVYPIKGQILKVKGIDLDKVYYSEISYIIPKEGHILVGATSEDAGFDSRTTLAGVKNLLEGAIRVIPSMANAELLSVRVGFRPATPDEMPAFGLGENYAILTGHYRNGILWAPASASMVVDLLDKNERSPYFDHFSVDRFAE